MKSMYYKLTEDHQTVPCEAEDFRELMESAATRRVASTHVGERRTWVSTVFLGLDYSFSDDGPPILFETMVFDEDEKGKTDFSERYMERYSTWDEAEAGHKRIVEALERGELLETQ